MNIVVLGPPGAGKDTQGTILAQCLDVPHISMGELLRSVPNESGLGLKIRSIIDTGRNVEPEISVPLLLRTLKFCHDGFVLNNFPRSLEQLEVWKKILAQGKITIDHVIALEVPEEIGVRRMLERAEQSTRGRQKRGDEAKEVIESRKKVGYDEAAQATISFYESRTHVHHINGTPPIGEVAAAIWSAIHG